jgi:guanine nucleotide-binding protein alpha-1 subunit
MTHAQGTQSSSIDDPLNDLPQLNPELWMVKLRLSPLLHVEQVLTRRLNPLDSGETEPTYLGDLSYAERSRSAVTEFAVNATAQWKNKFSRLLRTEDGDIFDAEQAIDWDGPDDPDFLLHTCSADMTRLWGDPTIHQLLEKQNIRLEEMAGL